MRTKIFQAVMLATTILLLAANWVLRSDPSMRNVDVLPDMAASIPYDSFASNPNFADGMTLRKPVEGTVIRGHLPMHYKATPEEALRAGKELVSPLGAKPERALARGAVVYANFCETCHGPGGKGDGRVAQRGFPMPASLIAPRALQMADGQMFHVLTYGQANMPSYAAQIARDDRWAVIAFVRSLQKQELAAARRPA